MLILFYMTGMGNVMAELPHTWKTWQLVAKKTGKIGEGKTNETRTGTDAFISTG